MEVRRPRGEEAYITFPMIDAADPDHLKSGETVTDTAYYKDGSGAWTSLAITDTVAEIGSTGEYEITLSSSEMDHDQIVIKLTSTNGQDQTIVISTLPENINSAYPDGLIHVDSDAGNTNTQLGVDGTIANPVSTIAAAKTLADQLNEAISIKGTFLNTTTNLYGYRIVGADGIPNLDGDTTSPMSIGDCLIENVYVSGKYICSNDTQFYRCDVVTDTSITGSAGLAGRAIHCSVAADIYMAATKITELNDCYTDDDSANDEIRINLAGASWHDLTINNFRGQISLNSNSSTASEIVIAGDRSTRVVLESTITAVDIIRLNGVTIENNTSLTSADLVVVSPEDYYPDGYVYLDGNVSNASNIPGIDGTKDNPVNTFAAIKTLGDALGKRVKIKGWMNTADAQQDFTNYEFRGVSGLARFIGDTTTAPNLSKAKFHNVQVEGRLDCDSDTRFYNCRLIGNDSNITGGTGFQGEAHDCTFSTGIYIPSSGFFFIFNGKQEYAHDFYATLYFPNDTSTCAVSISGWHGEVPIRNMVSANNSLYVNADEKCRLNLNNSNTAGTIKANGGCEIQNGGSGMTITYLDPEIKYPDGYVYFDSNVSNTNGDAGVDGTASNPTSNFANAVAIANVVGKKILGSGQATSITSSLANFEVKAKGKLRLDGDNTTPMNIGGATFHNVELRGKLVGFAQGYGCTLREITQGLDGRWWNPKLENSLYVENEVSLYIMDSYSDDLSPAVFHFPTTGAFSRIHVAGHKGPIEVEDLTTGIGGHFYLHSDWGAELELMASCDQGNAYLAGSGKFVDSSGGGITIERTDWKDINEAMREVYPDGKVFFDSGATANTNTVVGVDGTPWNPVTSEAAAKTLAEAVSKKICVMGTLPLTVDYSAGFEFFACDGASAVVGSGSANITDCILRDLDVSGLFTCGTNTTKMYNCRVHDITSSGIATGLAGYLYQCGVHSDIAIQGDSSDEIHFFDCFEAEVVAGDKPTIDFTDNTRQSDLIVRNFKGTLNIKNILNVNNDLQLDSQAGAIFNLDSSINQASANIILTGIGALTDNSTAANVDTTNWVEFTELEGLDWSINEKTEIKTVLGITDTGTPDSTPSDGVLKEIQDNVDLNEAGISVIEGQTSKLDFDGDNHLSSNVKKIDDDASSAANASKSAKAIYTGLVGAGAHTTTTILATDLLGYPTDAFKNKSFNVTSGAAAEGAGGVVETYNPGTGGFTFKTEFPLPAVPASGHSFVVQ